MPVSPVFVSQMMNSSREAVEHSVQMFMGSSGFVSLLINLFGLYLIIHNHGIIDDYRYYLLYFQTILLIFDVYFSIFMIPIPLFPIIGGYSIGVLSNVFEISTHHQMIFALWCVGNTNTCIFISLLKRHQVVAAIEQKNTIAPRILRFSKLSSNLLPLLGTIFYAFTEPDQTQKVDIINQKYPGSNWLLQIPGIVIYDISYSLNPSFLFLTYGIMFGTLMLFSAYCVLYAQMYFMLGSMKSRISVRTYRKHVVAVISTIMQNLVFLVFFIAPIFLLAIVIYSGSDASATCIIMVCVFSLHSSANTIVMSLTFPAFRQTMFAIPHRICRTHERMSVSPVNNVSRTAPKIKITSVHF